MHHQKMGAVWVTKDAKGLYEDNDMYNNGKAHIRVWEMGDPVVKGNRIRDGRSVGILVYEFGKGHYVDNEISGNRLWNIEIRRHAAGVDPAFRPAPPTLPAQCRSCPPLPPPRESARACNHRLTVLVVAATGTRSSSATGSTAAAWVACTHGAVVARTRTRNSSCTLPRLEPKPTVHHRRVPTRRTWNCLGCRFTLKDNDIYNNTGPGVNVGTDGSPVVEGNRIYGGHTAGVEPAGQRSKHTH